MKGTFGLPFTLVLREKIRKDPFPDAFGDGPVYRRLHRHGFCMEPHPFHKEHILFQRKRKILLRYP